MPKKAQIFWEQDLVALGQNSQSIDCSAIYRENESRLNRYIRQNDGTAKIIAITLKLVFPTA